MRETSYPVHTREKFLYNIGILSQKKHKRELKSEIQEKK